MGGVLGGVHEPEGGTSASGLTLRNNALSPGVIADEEGQDRYSSTRSRRRLDRSMACWIPRPKSYGAAVQLDLPRSAVGVNEYIYALSLRHTRRPSGAPQAHPLPPTCGVTAAAVLHSAHSPHLCARRQGGRAARQQPVGALAWRGGPVRGDGEAAPAVRDARLCVWRPEAPPPQPA